VGSQQSDLRRHLHVEVKIGVQHSPRELVIDSPKSPEEIAAEVSKAMTTSKDGLLTLVDERGRRIVVPTDRIAYVEIAEADQRRVGFIGG
jgi:hypothetical protein